MGPLVSFFRTATNSWGIEQIAWTYWPRARRTISARYSGRPHRPHRTYHRPQVLVPVSSQRQRLREVSSRRPYFFLLDYIIVLVKKIRLCYAVIARNVNVLFSSEMSVTTATVSKADDGAVIRVASNNDNNIFLRILLLCSVRDAGFRLCPTFYRR